MCFAQSQMLGLLRFFDELGGMEGIKQNQTNGTDVNSRLVDDDDDFESASQVRVIVFCYFFSVVFALVYL